jgi:hypothetical protein
MMYNINIMYLYFILILLYIYLKTYISHTYLYFYSSVFIENMCTIIYVKLILKRIFDSSILSFSVYIKKYLIYFQVNTKTIVAYSSVVHINFIISSLFSLLRIGALRRVIVIVSHGLCSSGLFYIINMYYLRSYRRTSRSTFLAKSNRFLTQCFRNSTIILTTYEVLYLCLFIFSNKDS